MSTPAFTLASVMTNILTALQDILGNVAQVLAQNAQVIATVIVLGGLTYVLVRYGRRIFSGISGFFRF